MPEIRIENSHLRCRADDIKGFPTNLLLEELKRQIEGMKGSMPRPVIVEVRSGEPPFSIKGIRKNEGVILGATRIKIEPSERGEKRREVRIYFFPNNIIKVKPINGEERGNRLNPHLLTRVLITHVVAHELSHWRERGLLVYFPLKIREVLAELRAYRETYRRWGFLLRTVKNE